MEKHSVSRLVGSPPGYVGHEEGGQLTEIVRRKPYSVILFDEIEKAHPDVFNILLQILEDGRLTDSQGRTVDFRNAILIMTSNIGAEHDHQGHAAGLRAGGDTKGMSYDDMKSRITGELKRVFRPEFLNRVDEVIVFHKLDARRDPARSSTCMIAALPASSSRRAACRIELTDAGRDLLVEKGYDPMLGARPLRRAIQRYIEDKLSDVMLERQFARGHRGAGRPPTTTTRVLTVNGEERGRPIELPLVGLDEPFVGAAAGSLTAAATVRRRQSSLAEAPARARPGRGGRDGGARTTRLHLRRSAGARRASGSGTAPTAAPGTRSSKRRSWQRPGAAPAGAASRPATGPAAQPRGPVRPAPSVVSSAAERFTQRHRRARPRARRRHRAGLARAGRRRARHRQVHAAAAGARPGRRRPSVLCMLVCGEESAARSRCAPSASAAGPAPSTCSPRPSSRPCSRRSPAVRPALVVVDSRADALQRRASPRRRAA